MKSYYFIYFVLTGIFGFYNVQAQEFEPDAGIKAGLNISNIAIAEIDDQNMRYGYHAGLFAQIPIHNRTGFQVEVLYTTKGATFTTNEDFEFGIIPQREVEIEFNYLDVPIVFVYNLSEFWALEAGLVNAFLLKSSVEAFGIQFDEEISENDFRQYDLALVGGVNFNVNPLTLGLRYNLGLLGIGKDGIPGQYLENSENKVIQFFTALNF